MQTSGHGNDSWMIFLVIAVTAVVGTILFGGPTNTVEAMDMFLREIAYETMAMASRLFS